MNPQVWGEAGAAPNFNIAGRDPGLRDPEHGDFHADLAPEYGCRVFPRAGHAPSSPTRSVDAAWRPTSRGPRAARVEVAGPIAVDTVWDADTVRVVADVEVVDGASLTIGSGARVVFAGFFNLAVRDGDLQAVGEPQAPIVFTAAHPELYAEDHTTAGCWNGLTLANVPAANDSTRLSWCVFEYAKAVPRTGRDREAVGGAVLEGAGGALRIVGTDQVRVDHCRLRHNCADRGGAMLIHYQAAPLLVDNLLHDNCGLERAGAIFVSYSYPRIVHTTIAGNRAVNPSAFVATGAVDHYHAKPLHIGNIVHGNETNCHDDTQVREPRAYCSHHCLIGGFAAGEGHLDGDPGFDGGGPEPFALAADSPCRDAGDAAAAGGWLPALDLAGAARWQGAAPDVGAFEVAALTAVAPRSRPVALLALAVWPNPGAAEFRLRFELPTPAAARLDVLDLRGRVVRSWLVEDLAAGAHEARWDGRDHGGQPVAAGTYLARLAAGEAVAARRIQVVR